MTAEQMMIFLKDEIIPDLIRTREVANREYSNEENAFQNFEKLAAELGLDRKKVLWVFLKKHLDGILAGINGFKAQREPVQGRCKDAMVYLALLWAIFEEEDKKLKLNEDDE